MVKLAAPATVNSAGWAPVAWPNTFDAMDTADTQPRPERSDPSAGRSAGRRQRQLPWSPRAWAQALCVAGGIPVLAATPILPLLIIRHGRHHPGTWALMALLDVEIGRAHV